LGSIKISVEVEGGKKNKISLVPIYSQSYGVAVDFFREEKEREREIYLSLFFFFLSLSRIFYGQLKWGQTGWFIFPC